MYLQYKNWKNIKIEFEVELNTSNYEIIRSNILCSTLLEKVLH